MDFVAKAAFKQQAKAVGNDFFGSEDKESKAEAERKKKHANAQEDAYRNKQAAKRKEEQTARHTQREQERDRIRSKYSIDQKVGRRVTQPGEDDLTDPNEASQSKEGDKKGCVVC